MLAVGKPSNKRPPPAVEDVTCGAAGGDLAFVKFVNPENGDAFSCDFWGRCGVVAGNVKPLNASVSPPKSDDCDCDDAKVPNDPERSCC